MEFWGVEVPPKKPLKCDPGSDSYFHVSQAALGEAKDKAGNERVVLKVRVGENEYVVGTLSQGKCDQTPLDLIFDKEFSLSHNSTSSTVYFCGYKTEAVKDQFDVSDDEEDVPDNVAFPMKANGKVNPKSVNTEKDKASAKEKNAITTEKPAAKTIPATKEKPDLVEIKSAPSKAKPGAKMATEDEEDEKDDDDDIDDEDEDDEEEDEEDEGEDDESDEDDDEGEDDELDFLDSDDEDESEGRESEEDDLKSAPARKRLMAKPKEGTPSKKMKLGTPFQGKGSVGAKSEGKPSTPASTTKQQTPGKNVKSGAFAKKSAAQENASPLQAAKGAKSNTPGSGKKFGQFLCNTCNRSFATETGLSQHQTAKHSK